MARIEARIPCPKCGRKFPLPLDQMQSGASTACPQCGQTITFQGGARPGSSRPWTSSAPR